MAYELHHHAPISRKLFIRRLLIHFAIAMAVLIGSLGIGMAGYWHFERLEWRDGFLNSAMLLGGMGPIDAPKTPGGKLFAGAYALYAGLVFFGLVALMVAPLLHRMMHQFHWKEDKRT